MAHISPSAIFSPSVARQHLATAKDWNHVDAWLTSKYHPKAPPPIERTPETLKALLTLSSLNETTDEQQELLHLCALQAITSLRTTKPSSLLDNLLENLSREGETALEALATLHQSLNLPDGDITDLGRKILDLQVQDYELDQTAQRLETMHKYLSTEHQTLDSTISQLSSPTFQVPPSLIKETSEYARKAKNLTSKIPEMRDRVRAAEKIANADGGSDYPTIQEVIEEERAFKELEKEVRELEGMVRGYQGLPMDTDLARLEVEGLRVELRELVGRRDELFEGLVERETPRKGR